MSLLLDGTKVAWHKDRVQAWARGERIMPITIDMALTRACNYNCVYCYSKLQENERKELTWDVLHRFIKDAAGMGVKAISLVSDGESTLHKDWVKFIEEARYYDIDMAIGTNGFALTETQLRYVLPELTYIRFNISAEDMWRYCEIHGVPPLAYHRVLDNIKTAVRIKKENKLKVTIGLQMVLMPEFADQIIPMAKFGKELGVDYLVIKHCSDDENGQLGVNYNKYTPEIFRTLHEAETYSAENYQVVVKWSKINHPERTYTHCYGPPFIMQLSGSGLVAPCGMLFNDKYKEYHIGNIAEDSFYELWKGDRWWEVMEKLRTSHDSKTMCGSLCLQHKTNEYLDQLVKSDFSSIKEPEHINFI